MKKERYWRVSVYVHTEAKPYLYDTYYIVAQDDVVARDEAIGIAFEQYEMLEEEKAIIAFCEIELKGSIYYDG